MTTTLSCAVRRFLVVNGKRRTVGGFSPYLALSALTHLIAYGARCLAGRLARGLAFFAGNGFCAFFNAGDNEGFNMFVH